MVWSILFSFQKPVAIWQEFGKDLSENLENQLIIFPIRRGCKPKTKEKAKRMKQIHTYTLNLTKIEGNGDFQCPRCGTTISPDDWTEETYTILKAKVTCQGLDELVIRCNKCESQLHLTGFSLLQSSEIDKEKLDEKRDESPCYITHV